MEIITKQGPFFSVTLGKWVRNYKEFDEELDKMRYMTRMEKHLRRENGYNRTPREEWIASRNKEETEKRKEADRYLEEDLEWQEKRNRNGS